MTQGGGHAGSFEARNLGPTSQDCRITRFTSIVTMTTPARDLTDLERQVLTSIADRLAEHDQTDEPSTAPAPSRNFALGSGRMTRWRRFLPYAMSDLLGMPLNNTQRKRYQRVVDRLEAMRLVRCLYGAELSRRSAIGLTREGCDAIGVEPSEYAARDAQVAGLEPASR